MADLEELTVEPPRRQFLKKSARVGIGILTVSSPFAKAVAAQKSRRYNFQSGFPYNIESLQSIVPKAFRDPYNPTPLEESLNIQSIHQQYPLLKGINLKLVESFQGTWFKPEPDTEYSNRLIAEAKKSIDHMIRFLSSPYIKKPKIVFKTPKREEDVQILKGATIEINIVSELGHGKFYVYGIEGTTDTFRLTYWETKHGELQTEFNVSPNLEVQTRNWPVFYNSRTGIVGRVEAPAIEILHKLMESYLIERAKSETRRNPNSTPADLKSLILRNIELSEKFVHALSILWLRRYNKDENLGLTDKELEERSAKYEKAPIYRGTNQMARYIAGLDKDIRIAEFF